MKRKHADSPSAFLAAAMAVTGAAMLLCPLIGQNTEMNRSAAEYDDLRVQLKSEEPAQATDAPAQDKRALRVLLGFQGATQEPLELPKTDESPPEIDIGTGADLAACLAQNDDFIAWIKIPGTNVDYPVVWTDDAEHYLHHTFTGKQGAAGTLFSLMKTDYSIPSRNIAIYRVFEETFRGSLGSRERKEQEYPIPPLEIGQIVGPVVATIREGQTTPPKRYTEDTLLAAMETAGAKDAPEDAERKGLGTPATRAGTLEKLVDVGFVVRRGEQKAKSLYPTEKAAALIAVLPENLRSPMMTAQWEQRLKRIEHGQEEAAGFMDDIVRMVTELVQSAQPVPDAQKLFPSDRPSVGKVPDVDELPVIIVSRLEPDDEGLKQKISDGGELSYKDLSGMSIGKTDEQSIYNINIQQCRTRSYLCINDFWNYERENDVAQMYANDNAYSLADVKEKMGELFRSLYPCEDEIELQKAEFNICYLSKDEKEVENGNLVGIGEYSLTGNQVIAGIPILVTAASGYKLEGKESRIEDEMRMMANTIFLCWRDEKEWALMTRGIVEEKETVEEDIKLCSLETVLECIRDAMAEGKIECVYSLELGYVLYAKSGETYTKKDKNAEFCLMPTWVVKCGYQNEIPIEPEEAELSAYDYMDNLGFQNVLINAQTGKMTDPKGARKVYDTPKIIR